MVTFRNNNNNSRRNNFRRKDKILSENYLQHADHFTRVINEREFFKRENSEEQKSLDNEQVSKESTENNDDTEKKIDDNLVKESNSEAPVEVN